MATITTIVRTCDMPHNQSDLPDEPAETYELYSKADGRYEVDLCEAHAAFVFAMASNGRKIKGTRK